MCHFPLNYVKQRMYHVNYGAFKPVDLSLFCKNNCMCQHFIAVSVVSSCSKYKCRLVKFTSLLIGSLSTYLYLSISIPLSLSLPLSERKSLIVPQFVLMVAGTYFLVTSYRHLSNKVVEWCSSQMR